MNLSDESENAHQPIASPGRDAKRLKRSSGATADELREFLAEMRGKSPKEMLGAVASSNLGKSLVQATIGTVVLIVVLTVIPFAWNKMSSGGDAEIAQEEVVEGEVVDEVKEEPEVVAETPEPVAPAEAADTLGIGEAVEAPAGVNPLDSSNDDLLKGLE